MALLASPKADMVGMALRVSNRRANWRKAWRGEALAHRKIEERK